MSPRLGAVAFHLLPALVWAIIARACWRVLRDRRPDGPVFRLLPLITAAMALHYFLHAAIELTPTQLGGRLPNLHFWLNIFLVLSQIGFTALIFHLIPVLAIREERPSRRWLVLNYGAAAIVACVALVPLVVPEWPIGSMENWTVLYGLVIVVLIVRKIRRLKRAGTWPRHFDVAFNTTLVAAVGGLAILAALGIGSVLSTPVFSGIGIRPVPISLLAHTAWGLAVAAPFAAAMFGEMLRALVVAVVMIGVALLVAIGAPRVTIGLDPELTALADVGIATVVLFAFIPGRAWLSAAVEWLVFRQRRRSRHELEAFLQRLSPELGVVECSRRALAEFTRVLGPRGVGILLAEERGRAVHGDFALDPVARAWPTTAAGLPARAFSLYGLRDATLRTALAAANVALVVPLVSPRRHWGHLFVAEGLLSRAVRDERDVEQIEAFAAQLALLLAAADLLARAVAVERSLAHAEKLAAIGETAARIAHDIRNPVTAARSLAQQLSREPASPLNAEHAGLILMELERVEHQVASLLRFARRDELRFETVDVAALVRRAVEQFRSRFAEADVAVELDATEPITARADAEKLRQVVINLVENALDAFDDGTGTRRLRIDVGRRNGAATVRIADTGVGVPAEVLPRLFEPFFSLKAKGTGLGLAIAKRTVDAHGGRIVATSTAGEGTTVSVELPLTEMGRDLV